MEIRLQAGFSRGCITPRAGDPMEGLGQPDSTSIHDDLFLGCCWLSHAGMDVLIVGCDLLFFERKAVDRFKGAIGRRFDLLPKQIFINTSHNHAGPRLTHWAYSDGPNPLYLDQIETAILDTAADARAHRRSACMTAGTTRCALPMSRRRIGADGRCEWAPSHLGPVCDAVPFCHITDTREETIALLFSASCHPSTWYETAFSADFPGVAQRYLNRHFTTDGALFLQGVGGDAKPRPIGEGRSLWNAAGGFDAVETAGRMLADAVIDGTRNARPVAPALACVYTEMSWPLQTPMPRDALEAIVTGGSAATEDPRGRMRFRWAREMLERLDRFGVLPSSVPVGLHGVQLGEGVRMIGLEGEAVAELGQVILDAYPLGVTFPLSYTNGAQLYLTVSRMHEEGGYEVDSYPEYHWPAELAPGGERRLADCLAAWRQSGVMPHDDFTNQITHSKGVL